MGPNAIGLMLIEEEIRTQTHTEGRPYENRERRCLIISQGERPQKVPTLLTL